MKKIIIALVLLVCIGLGAVGYVGYKTFSTTGDAAIAEMDESELVILEKINLIQRGMTYEEVVDILGTPDRDVMGLRPTWKISGSGLNQIAIYFMNGTTRKIRWMKIGVFIYEKELSKVNNVIIEGAEPTDDEIYEIEIQLESFIKKNPPQYRKPITDISRYKIQYSVIKNKEGKRLIFINGVCKDYWPEVKDWEKELVVVLDGGDCFFNLKFDPKTKNFMDFWINGEA